jgi:hypothetical protein
MNLRSGKRPLVEKLANRPEFTQLLRQDRERIASVCLRAFRKSRLARFFEMLLGIMSCVAVFAGLVVGYLQWGFWGALIVMSISVALAMGIFTIIFQIAWKCWLRDFLKGVRLQEFPTSSEKDS